MDYDKQSSSYEHSNDGYDITHYNIYFNNRYMYKAMKKLIGHRVQ